MGVTAFLFINNKVSILIETALVVTRLWGADMDYFSKFLRTTTRPSLKAQVDHAQEFHKSWDSVKVSLHHFSDMHI